MLTVRAVVTGLLAVFNVSTVRRGMALMLAGLLVLGFVVPQPARAQLGLGGLFGVVDTILNTINNVLKGLFDAANSALSSISSVLQAFGSFMQTVIYPQSLITQARSMVSSMITQFRGLLASIFNIRVTSAQLPAPVGLEAIMRNRSTGDLGALSTAYAGTYGPVPPPTDADSADRDLIDMDDAMAQGVLKMLKASDAASDQTIATSMLLEDEGRQVAPGTADYLLAAGVIAAVQNQAVMQKMLAAQMRQEAAELAHQNMIRKRNATFGADLRQNLSTALRGR